MVDLVERRRLVQPVGVHVDQDDVVGAGIRTGIARNTSIGPAPRIATESPMVTLMLSTQAYVDDIGSARVRARTGRRRPAP